MYGVDAALRTLSMDRYRPSGRNSGSYGGFMDKLDHRTHRPFKAAVTLRSVVNFISDEGTRDGAYGHTPDFEGDVFERFETYWDRSPLKYRKKRQDSNTYSSLRQRFSGVHRAGRTVVFEL
jgi:hypothetical protein